MPTKDKFNQLKLIKDQLVPLRILEISISLATALELAIGVINAIT